jgi:hypothetical protein
MTRDNLTQTLRKFDRGDRLSLGQLMYLNKHLWKKYYASKMPIEKQKWRDKCEEVQVEIEYWVEVEKTHPFASQEKYVK